MERQSEQELLEIAPVETEVLEGNRIYKVTGRESVPAYTRSGLPSCSWRMFRHMALRTSYTRSSQHSLSDLPSISVPPYPSIPRTSLLGL